MTGSFRVNGIWAGGSIAGDIIPTVTNAVTLGSASLRFANVYSVLGNFSGAVDVGSLVATTSITAGTTAGVYGINVTRSVNNDYMGLLTNSYSGANSYGLRVVTTGSTSATATVFEAASLGASKTFAVYNDGHVVTQGTMTATGYIAGASTGIDFSGAVTNITVVKGIVTAAS